MAKKRRPLPNPTPVPHHSPWKNIWIDDMDENIVDNTIWIVAGSFAEYLEYYSQHGGAARFQGKTFCYVDNPDVLKGVKNPHGICIGDWKNHPKAIEIIQKLHDCHNANNPAIHKLYTEILAHTLKGV